MGHERHPRQPDPHLLHTKYIMPLALHGLAETRAAALCYRNGVRWVYRAHGIPQRRSMARWPPALLRSAEGYGFLLLDGGTRLSDRRGGDAYPCAGVLPDADGIAGARAWSGDPF